MREARERQRLLSGIVQMGPMMMGSGAGFTDLPNLILRDAVLAGLRPENREAFDAALRSIEQRTLSQARAHNAETRKAILSFFPVYSAAAASMEDVGGEGVDADAAADGQMRNMEEQQRQIETAMREVGRELRKGIKSNFAANCAACAQLASLLPESAVLSLRTELARHHGNDGYVARYRRPRRSEDRRESDSTRFGDFSGGEGWIDADPRNLVESACRRDGIVGEGTCRFGGSASHGIWRDGRRERRNASESRNSTAPRGFE